MLDIIPSQSSNFKTFVNIELMFSTFLPYEISAVLDKPGNKNNPNKESSKKFF